MEWTAAQREELAREYARIGIEKGERLPYPDDARLSEPPRFLGLLRSIADGAGVTGYIAALGKQPSGNAPHHAPLSANALCTD